MTIIATNFSKITVEKKAAVKGKVGISNNVNIKKVDKTDIVMGSAKQAALRFHFEFTAKYEPKIGEIKLEGEVVKIEKPEKVKEVLDEWKKNKKVQKDLMGPILNNVLMKCNVEALLLSREINLPPPVQLPKVKVSK